eukprot:gene1862-2099_t
MLHYTTQTDHLDFATHLLPLTDFYDESYDPSVEATEVSMLTPKQLPSDLSKILVYEITDCVTFVNTDAPLHAEELTEPFYWFTQLQERARHLSEFTHFRNWFRLVNYSYIEIQHHFYSQKRIFKDYIRPHFNSYNFRFYGLRQQPELIVQLATYLKLLPYDKEPWCKIDYSLRCYKPFTTWHTKPHRPHSCIITSSSRLSSHPCLLPLSGMLLHHFLTLPHSSHSSRMISSLHLCSLPYQPSSRPRRGVVQQLATVKIC